MSMDINELIKLFSKVCEDAAAFAQLSVRLPNRPSSDTASQLFYGASKSIEKALKNIETHSLVIPIITGAMEHITKIYAVSLEELLSGGFEARRARYEKLMTELNCSSIALEWSSTNKKISEVIERLGLHPDNNLLGNMPRVAEIMLNAFEFFDQYHTKIIKVASGESSDEKPFFMRSMPQCATIGEFYDLFKEIPTNSAIMLAVIAPTYTQSRDPLDVWKSKVKGEHQDNYNEAIFNSRRRDKDFDPETAINNSASKIVVGVKRRENIWLIIHSDESPYNGNVLNFHGQRTSYMPFQVLFPNAPTPNKECTNLALQTKSWNLLSIIDKEQALWFPTFLWLIEKRFFASDADANEPIMYLKEMVQANNERNNSSLPVVQKLITLDIDPFTVPESYGLETSPECNEFIKNLEITKSDIADAVFAPKSEFADESRYQQELWFAQREALAYLAKAKLKADFRNNQKELYAYFINAIENNRSFLLSELEKSDSLIHSIAEHQIDGQPEMKDGKILTTKGSYGYGINPVVMKTSADSAKRSSYSRRAIICSPPTLYGRRPPVCINLRVSTPEELSYVSGIPTKELPWQFALAGKCQKSHVSPFESTNFDPMMVLDNPYKDFPTATIALGKKEYKQLFPDKLMSKFQISELLAEVREMSEAQVAEMRARIEREKRS